MERKKDLILQRPQMRNLLLITLLLIGFSCQNEDNTVQPSSKVTVKPLTDQRIKAEILSMVKGTFTSSNGKTNVAAPPGAPQLPSGYDYDNMQEVQIEGTNWTTYVAYSLTENTSTNKKMVGIYYESGTYRNFMHVEWQYANSVYRYKYLTPPGYPQYYDTVHINPSTGVVKVPPTQRVRPPSACGQQVSDCIQSFYTQQGWWSVGLTLATIVAPEIGVGVVGGCMLGCALGY